VFERESMLQKQVRGNELSDRKGVLVDQTILSHAAVRWWMIVIVSRPCKQRMARARRQVHLDACPLCVGQVKGSYVSAVFRMPCWKRRNGDVIRLTNILYLHVPSWTHGL
jgi:hypothetical protein